MGTKRKNRVNFNLRNKKVRLGIIIVLIIIIILIIAVIILNNQSKALKTAQEELTYIQDSESWNEETIWPDKASYLILEYEGEVPSRSIGKSLYYVVTVVLPQYYSDLKNATDEEIEKYYDKNVESIYINLALENKTQFKSLIKGLQNLSGDTINFESYRIDENTIKVGANYTKAILYITYEENKEIALTITVKNKISDDSTSVVYTYYQSE